MAERDESLVELLAVAPCNWGRWGKDDELGSLNFLTAPEVMRGVGSVKAGKTFPLMLPVGTPGGDPLWPGRPPAMHRMAQDKGDYQSGRIATAPGGVEYADDEITINCHGTTHCDGLAHTWFDNKAWNGYDAAESKGGLRKAGILPVAERGIVGRAVLLDVARRRGVSHLQMHEQITLAELLQTARSQGIEIQQHDIVLVRTGILEVFYKEGPEAFYADFDEPGITYEPELVRWFYEMEIPLYGTDTLGNEQLVSSTVKSVFPLHAALSRNLGVVFVEALALDDWAEDCVGDGKYDALFVGLPLKLVGASASPLNPIVVK
ncbi:MAG: cyclase family protein [Chloroflexi bacterium]|nr:cyclase family protein [Chloroflexota bacterium]